MEKEIILDKDEHRRNRIYITPRELEIIEDLSNGLNSGEIASKRGITLKTAEVHRHNVLKKTEYKNTVHLVAEFLRKGLIK